MSQPTQKLAHFFGFAQEMGGFWGTGFSLCLFTLNAENIIAGKITKNLSICFQRGMFLVYHPVL